MRVWLLAPVRDRMDGERLCPSTGTPWAASRTASTVTWWLLPDVLVRVLSEGRVIAPFTTIPLAWLRVHSLLPRGSADLQRIAVCSTPSSGGLHRPCGREVLLTTLTTRRFSFLANDGFCTRFAVPTKPPLLPPTRARRCPPASAACATLSPAVRRAFSPSSASRLLQEGTARSAVPSDRARGMWRCRLCRCAAAMIC